MGVRYVGADVRRLEDPRLITGRGQYVDDILMPGTLHAAFVRSSHAHARIRAVNCEAARELPGVIAVYTLADFAAEQADKPMPLAFSVPLIEQHITQHPLAKDEVCYVGQTVAVVIAEDRYLAEDACAAVEVDYEALPAVVDCRESLSDGTPLVHSTARDNRVAQLKMGFGDVEDAFAKASHVLRHQLSQHRGGCHSMECRGVLAAYDKFGEKLSVWSATQTPHLVRRFLAQHLDMDEQRVKVAAPDVGGGFGPKAVFYAEEIVVSVAAMKLGRPVKWIEDRREHFLATTNQRDQYWDIEVACDETGKMLGMKAHVVHDNGAFVPYGLLLAFTSLFPLPGAYALPALEATMDVVFTNTTPTTPVRGAGRPNAIYAIERTVDLVARELGLDVAEARRRNFVQTDQFPYKTGMIAPNGLPITYDSGDYLYCLNRALELADAEGFRTRQAEARQEGRYLGLGVSSFIEDTGMGPYEGVTVRVTPKGRIQILTGAASQGQGHETTLAQICAEQLGVDVTQVSVESADTDKFPLGTGTVGSRIAVTAGSSAHEAAVKVKDKAIKLASQLLEAAEEDLVLEDGAVRVAGVPDMQVALGDVALRLQGTVGRPGPEGLTPGLEATAYFPAKITPHASGSNVAEVEVDIDTGAVQITNYVVVHDCGRVINPKIVDGQIYGGVVHGIGNVLFEHMLYDDNGQPVSTNYGEYLLPLASEMPWMTIEHFDNLSPLNPLGIKGVGESGTIPAIPAVVSAIEDALTPFNVRVDGYPLGPERIVNLIENARQPG